MRVKNESLRHKFSPACRLFLDHHQVLLRKTRGRASERKLPSSDPQVHQVHVLSSKLPQTTILPMVALPHSPFLTSHQFLHHVSSHKVSSPLFNCFLAAKFQCQSHILSFCYSSILFLILTSVSVIYSYITTSCVHNSQSAIRADLSWTIMMVSPRVTHGTSVIWSLAWDQMV